MNIVDIITTTGVATLLMCATIITAFRVRQLRDWSLVGLVIALTSLFLSYVVFSYNSIYGFSNFPYRYWLRSSNAALAISVIILSGHRYVEFRRAFKKIKEEARHEQ